MTRAAVKDLVAREIVPKLGDAVAKGDRGVLSVFCGPSGTGRTMAARLLARSLKLPLMQVNLGHAASKYIGETEKNLRSVLDAASGTPSVLFFDEADALFGKRTNVKDSHDRYANIETADLLKMLEKTEGVVVLSTNNSDNLNGAFVKRARCVVCFKDD